MNLYGPDKLVSKTSFQSFSEISCNFEILGKTPALLIKISILPNFSIVCLITFFTSFEFLTSALTEKQFSFDAASSNLSEFFDVMTIFAPFSKNNLATAYPIPLLPPVTIATLFSNCTKTFKKISSIT